MTAPQPLTHHTRPTNPRPPASGPHPTSPAPRPPPPGPQAFKIKFAEARAKERPDLADTYAKKIAAMKAAGSRARRYCRRVAGQGGEGASPLGHGRCHGKAGGALPAQLPVLCPCQFQFGNEGLSGSSRPTSAMGIKSNNGRPHTHTLLRARRAAPRRR